MVHRLSYAATNPGSTVPGPTAQIAGHTGGALLGRLEEAVGLFDRMRVGRLPADSPVLAARRGAWRRMLALYVVISVVCAVFAITSDDLTDPLALLAFAVLNLPPLWFVLFRTIPKGRT